MNSHPKNTTSVLGNLPFIIAEAGVNHNGSLAAALNLCSIALDSGADAVKFQTWKTSNLILPDTPQVEYQSANTGRNIDQFTLLKELELSYSDFEKIYSHCDKIGIQFLSTPDDYESLLFLTQSLGLSTIKIGSGELNNLSYLIRAAELSNHIILSTGMHNLSDVVLAHDSVLSVPNTSLSLLQCTSSYPCADEDLHLSVITSFHQLFGCPVGLSDHSQGTTAAIIATTLGASILEKHFTTDHDLPGPDHRASLLPHQLTEYINLARSVSTFLGTSYKSVRPCELDARKLATKYIVALQDISKGQILSSENIGLMRTSSPGLSGIYLDALINTRSSYDYRAGDSILCSPQ